MTKESSLWATFKGVLPADAHAVRVENSVELGTPDVNLCIPMRIEGEAWVGHGFDGWIELKVQQSPKREKTTFRCEHFTTEQRQWLVDRTRAGGKAYLLMQVEAPDTQVSRSTRRPRYLWLRGDIAAVWIGHCTLTELIEKCEWSGDSLASLIDLLCLWRR